MKRIYIYCRGNEATLFAQLLTFKPSPTIYLEWSLICIVKSGLALIANKYKRIPVFSRRPQMMEIITRNANSTSRSLREGKQIYYEYSTEFRRIHKPRMSNGLWGRGSGILGNFIVLNLN